MAEVKIVYWSGTGNTATMAEFVAKGVVDAGHTAKIVSFEDITPEDLAGDGAFALGCPSMGAEELEDSVVAPFNDELVSKVSGKNILLFGSYGWGNGEWMRNWCDQMSDAGANLIEAEGVICNDAPDTDAEDALIAAGKALAASV